MNLNKRFFCISAIAVLALAFAIAAAGSDGGVVEQNGEGVTVSASAVTTSSINYQGRLTDSAGEPLSGSYTMTFRLYEVASGGSALDTDTHAVDVTDGLFNTEIDFDPEYFDGRGLWLGVTVGIDSEMSPRQELRPVPYALSLKPGANIVGASSVALQAESTHTSGSGIRGYASAATGTNYGVIGESKSPDGYGGYFYNHEGGTGVYGEGGKYGGYFTTDQSGTSADRTAGVNVTTNYDYSDGIRARTSGDNSNGVHARTSGDFSYGVQTSTTGDNSSGVFAYTSGDDSPGVMASIYGENSPGIWAYSDKHYGMYGIGKSGGYFTTNQGGTSWADRTAGVDVATTYDYSYGVQAHTAGDNSNGVAASTSGGNSHGVSASTSGDNSNGVSAYTAGNSSNGVWAYSVKHYGVYGKGGKSGGYFTTDQGGTSGDHNAGVNATTTYQYSNAVRAYTTGDGSSGVDARTSGDSSYGVRARTSGDHSNGVYAITSGDSSYGVYAQTYGDNSVGVVAHSEKSNGIYANTWRSDHKYGVKTPDKMCAMSYDTGCADIAEYFPVAEEPEPGTVMVIGEDSKLQSSRKAYDTTVAGIVSTAPGVALGTNETGNEGEKLIAVAGRVPCKVDATYAPIEPGDLLTTSDTPGHAMKATAPQIGTILGKALEPLDSGTGVIEVLVTLQ